MISRSGETLRGGPRPQLTVDELHQVRWFLGGMLTLIGVASALYIDAEAWWLVGLVVVTSLATTFFPALPARVPRLVQVLAFPLMAASFAADLWLRSELLPAMVRLDLMLLLYRALLYRQRRDDLQVIVLGLFLIVVAGVLSVSLTFAVQILAYTACALLFLLVLTLVETTPTPGTAIGAGTSAVPPWAARVQWPRLLRRVLAVAEWRVAALGVGLFLGVVAITALLFLVIPRFQLDNGMFLDRFITKKARTGFSDSIKFGDVSEIQQDNGVALHVDVSDPTQIPTAPYWRMLVLDLYEKGTFRISPALRVQRFATPRTGSIVYGNGRSRRDDTRWVVYLEAGVSRYLPLLGPYRQIRFAEAQTYQSGKDMALVALTNDPVTMTAYQVDSFDLSSGVRDLPGAFYGEETSARSLTADERQILRRVATDAAGAEPLSAAEFASRVGAWLRERHRYSLKPEIPAGGGDPLVRWADSRGAGHCELFAGSFVLLARVAGHRARVVTGFRGGSWNGFSNSFTIHNSDAHAWAEIFDRGSGVWLRADPLELPATAQTEKNATAGAGARRLDRSWAARLDSLRVFWYRRVVSFDEQAQAQTLKIVKELAQSSTQRLRERFSRGLTVLRTWIAQPLDGRKVLALLGAMTVAAGLTWGWRRLRGGLSRWRRGEGDRDDPTRQEAGRWLRRLQNGRGAEEPCPAVVPDLQRLRFGPRQTWPEPKLVFQEARRALKDQRRSRTSLARA